MVCEQKRTFQKNSLVQTQLPNHFTPRRKRTWVHLKIAWYIHVPTFGSLFYGKLVGKYTIAMDASWETLTSNRDFLGV